MLSYSMLFGGGARLRSRPIWTGADRSIPGVVASQSNPFRARAGVTNNLMLERVAHNGTLYFATGGSGNFYTSPDLITLTSRQSGWAASSYAAIPGGAIVVRAFNSGFGVSMVHYTTDGATWGSIADVPGDYIEAGGTIYALAASGLFNAIPATQTGAAWSTVYLSAPRVWRNILHNGSKWLAVSADAADVSSNGAAFSAVAGYPDAMAAYMSGANNIKCFAIAERFVVFGLNPTGALASMWSADAATWNPGCSVAILPDGHAIHSFAPRGCVVGGTFYIKCVTISWASGTAVYCTRLASTQDGIDWRFSVPFSMSATAPVGDIGGVHAIVGTGAVMFNCTGFATGGAMETDIANGKELYYEL